MRALMLVAMLFPIACVAADGWSELPGGEFRSVLRYEDSGGMVRIAPFALMTHPVSNGDFLAFVQAHPEWQRSQVATVFADDQYLSHWNGASALGDGIQPAQPVTRVSWFAASAYCEAQGGRLPTWSEWEYAAAADESRTDARQDPAWRERILNWYARPSTAALPGIGTGTANAYGVHDLHGLVWEWVEDYAAMLVSSDSREQGDADLLRFCGAGAISTDDRENYAVLMRVAMLSALTADATTRNLGFRCARDLPADKRP